MVNLKYNHDYTHMCMIDYEKNTYDYNVFNFTNKELFNFIPEYYQNHVKQRISHYNNEQRVLAFNRMRGELYQQALYQQKNTLIISLFDDFIMFLGLHKYVDLDDLGHYKSFALHLFSKYNFQKFTKYDTLISHRINESIKINAINRISQEDLRDIVLYTQFRVNHLVLINEMISLKNYYFDQTPLKDTYIEISNDLEFGYPYTQYADEE